MNGTTLERPDVAAYLEAVRAELVDLPSEERDELVADLEAQLVESGESPRLSPREFAAELREAAGLHAAAPWTRLRSLRAWVAGPRAHRIAATARELLPIWWLGRAYVVVVVAALAGGYGWPLGSGVSDTSVSVSESVVVLLAAGVVSIWLGLLVRRRSWPHRRLAIGLNVALALAALPVAAHSIDQLDLRGYQTLPAEYAPVSGLALDGRQLRNLYPYSRDGRLLHDVLLYDDRGLPVPIMIGFDDPLRRVLERPDGRQLRNSFPIRYYEPGTQRVARPNLAPQIDVPEIATPPLETSR